MTLAPTLPHTHDHAGAEDFAAWLEETGLEPDDGADSHPDDPTARRELGRAHLLSGEPEKALDALAPLHRARPWDREVQFLMLDALFLLGRTEADYPWTAEPVVVRVGPELLHRFHDLLRREGRPATVLDLVLAATAEGYPAFQARELREALEADPRFTVHRSGLAPECAVVTVREVRS